MSNFLEKLFGPSIGGIGEHLDSGYSPFTNLVERIQSAKDNGDDLKTRLTTARGNLIDKLDGANFLDKIPDMSSWVTNYLDMIKAPLVSGGTIYDRIGKVFTVFDLSTDKLNHWKGILSEPIEALKTNIYRIINEEWDA
jgi:hypothetical protein